MILHTILPPEAVMAAGEPVTYETRGSHNCYIQGVNNGGKFTISRLISTDPSLYLDPRFTPGGQLEETAGRRFP